MLKRFLDALRMRFSPLMLRILAINLVSLLVLSLFNYIAFYNTNNKAYMKNVTDYHQRVTNIAFGNIDRQIMQNVAGIPSQFFSDILTNEALLLPQQRNISASPASIFNLTSKINDIIVAYPMVHSINIYYEGTQTIVTGRGNLHFVQSESELDLYLPWYQTYLSGGQTTLFTGLHQAVYPAQIYSTPNQPNGNEQVISLITRVQNPKWQGKGVVVALHISPRSFGEYIDEQQGTFLLTDRAGGIIYATPGNPQVAEIAAAAVSLPDGTSQLDALELVMSRSSNSALGLHYLHAVPYTAFFRDYNSYLQTLVLNYFLSVVVLTIMLLFISYLSNSAYSKRLQSLSKKAGLELSGNPESFDQSLGALTNQLSSLHSTVQHTLPMMYRSHVRSLILGKHVGVAYDDLSPMLGDYGGVFCIIATLTAADAVKLDLDALHIALQGEHTDCKILMTTLEQTQIVVLVCCESASTQPVRQRLYQTLDSLFIGHYAADSQWVELSPGNGQGFKTAFDSAFNICRYHFIFPHKTRLHYEQIGPVQIKHTGSHLKLFAEIEKDIISENLLDLKQRLYALTESFKFGSYSIDYCSSTLRDLVTLLYNITQNRQLDMWLTFGYDIRAHYRQIVDIDEFYRWSLELCEVLMQHLRQRKKGIDVDLHSQLLQLIDENLENNISLEFLADRLGLRPDVLSRTFKQLIGKSYIDYIKEKKLDRAKQLIAEDLSMKDISLRLGYNSTQYFIKIFKESYGVTPYQYKKHGMPE